MFAVSCTGGPHTPCASRARVWHLRLPRLPDGRQGRGAAVQGEHSPGMWNGKSEQSQVLPDLSGTWSNSSYKVSSRSPARFVREVEQQFLQGEQSQVLPDLTGTWSSSVR